MSRSMEEAKKEANEQRLVANTAKWKLSDAKIALKLEKDKHTTASR